MCFFHSCFVKHSASAGAGESQLPRWSQHRLSVAAAVSLGSYAVQTEPAGPLHPAIPETPPEAKEVAVFAGRTAAYQADVTAAAV